MNTLSFTKKLTILATVIVIVAMCSLSVISIFQVQKNLVTLGELTLTSVTDTLYRSVESKNEILLEKLESDLAFLKQSLNQRGNLSADPAYTTTMTITNQVTKKSEKVEIPILYAGGTMLSDNSVVDEIQQLVGGTATIFQVLPGKLLRISTNVRKTNGDRATGTYIPSDSPVYQTVMSGETFRGRAYVVNDWYLTTYAPLKNSAGEIVAVAYVGRKIITDTLTNEIISTNVAGNGYGFVYNSDGTLLIHPSDKLRGQSLADYPFGPALIGNTGIVRYEFGGSAKITSVRYFEPWDFYVAFGETEAELLHGIDSEMVRTNAITAGGLALIAMVVVFLAIRVAMRPLQRLTKYTQTVASGDYNASIKYPAKDLIGQTIDGVRSMVHEIKERLGFSQGILAGMSVPMLVVDKDENITLVNQLCLDMLEREGKPDDYVGQKAADFFYNDPTRKTIISQAMQEGHRINNKEVELTTHKDNFRHIILNVSPLYDLDGELLGGFCLYLDRTAAKQQEQDIHQKNAVITRVAGEAHEIAELVSSASEELAAQVEQTARGSEEQNARTTDTATAMEEMNATVLEVARSAGEAAENGEAAREQARSGEKAMQDVAEAIDEVARQAVELEGKITALGDEAKNIGQIITVIRDIADQTNLLALNAAIEAARAGEAGKGFAVVADEVRKLAEKTMDATKDVENVIGTIQTRTKESIRATQDAAGAITRSTMLAEEASEALEQIVTNVDVTAGQIQNIASASEQQSATSEEISRAVEDISRISQETSAGMGEAANAVNDLAQRADELKRLIEDLTK